MSSALQKLLRMIGPLHFGNRRLDSFRLIRSYAAKRLHRYPGQLSLAGSSDLLVNIGCGKKTMEGWINIDYQWNPRLEICWDITKPLPIPDSSCAGVYSEHCLEPFSKEQATSILKESFRILKPGGVLCIAVPDIELYIVCTTRIDKDKRLLCHTPRRLARHQATVL